MNIFINQKKLATRIDGFRRAEFSRNNYQTQKKISGYSTTSFRPVNRTVFLVPSGLNMAAKNIPFTYN